MTVTVHTKKYLLLAAVLTSLYPGCGAQPPVCANYPIGIQNAAQFQGSPTSFARTDNDQSLRVQWQVIPSDQENSDAKPFSITNFDDIVVPTLTSSYKVNATHLIILNSTIGPQGMMPYATGGAYILTYQSSGCGSEAGLIVVYGGPTCGCNTSDPNNKILNCSIKFTRYRSQYIIPIMTWRDCSGNVVDADYYPEYEPSDYYIPDQEYYNSQYTVPSTGGGTYTCQVNFSQPIPYPSSSVATNAPVFTASCSANCTLPPAPQSPTSCSDQKLINTVVYVGNSTAFLRADDGQSVQWQVIPSFPTINRPTNITDCSDALISEYTSIYQVNGSQLTVLSATVDNQTSSHSTAGLYIKNIKKFNCSTAANLIVINTPLSCASNTSNPNNVTLMCTVIYAEPTTQACSPVFTWTNNAGLKVETQKPIYKQISLYLKSAQSQYAITSSDKTTYTCQLTYSAPSQFPFAYVATNAPSFNASCSVSA